MKKKKKKNNPFDDYCVRRSSVRGFALPFILFFVGLFPIIESTFTVNSKIKAEGEIVLLSKDTTTFHIKGKEQPFLIPSYILKKIDKTKIHNGDYAKILYRCNSPTISRIEQLDINGKMLYKYNGWLSFNDQFAVSLWFMVIGAILIPYVIKDRNEDVREYGFDSAGPIISTFIKVYPDEEEELTDIDYNEQPSVVNDVNLVYYSDMDYSVYKTDDKEIISVVFRDENGAYCRYFTLPDTEEEKDYSQLADLANDIRNNSINYAENEIFDA